MALADTEDEETQAPESPTVTSASGASPVVPSAPSDATPAYKPVIYEQPQPRPPVVHVPWHQWEGVPSVEGVIDPGTARRDKSAMDRFNAQEMYSSQKKEQGQINLQTQEDFKAQHVLTQKNPETGIIEPVRDEQGNITYKTGKGPIEYNDQGKAVQTQYGETGPQRVELDKNADIGTHPDQPNALYRKNKHAPWDYLGTVQEASQSPDESIRNAASSAQLDQDKELHSQVAHDLSVEVSNRALAVQNKTQDYRGKAETLKTLNAQLDNFDRDHPGANETEGHWFTGGAKPTETASTLQEEKKDLQKQIADLESQGYSQKADEKNIKKFAAPEIAALNEARGWSKTWVAPKDKGELDRMVEDRKAELITKGSDVAGDPILSSLEKRKAAMGVGQPAQPSDQDKEKFRDDPIYGPLITEKEKLDTDRNAATQELSNAQAKYEKKLAPIQQQLSSGQAQIAPLQDHADKLQTRLESFVNMPSLQQGEDPDVHKRELMLRISQITDPRTKAAAQTVLNSLEPISSELTQRKAAIAPVIEAHDQLQKETNDSLADQKEQAEGDLTKRQNDLQKRFETADAVNAVRQSQQAMALLNATLIEPTSPEFAKELATAKEEAATKEHKNNPWAAFEPSDFEREVASKGIRFLGEGVKGFGELLEIASNKITVENPNIPNDYKDEGSRALANMILKVPGIIDSGASNKNSLSYKAGGFLGQVGVAIGEAVVSPYLLIGNFVGQGANGQGESAQDYFDKKAAANPNLPRDLNAEKATIEKAKVLGGAINGLMAIPFGWWESAASSVFGSTKTNIISNVLKASYERGGLQAVAEDLNVLKAAIFKTAGPAAFRETASTSMQAVIDEITKAPLRRAAAEALPLAGNAAIFGAVQTAQNLVTRTYNEKTGLFENVPAAAGQGAILHAFFGGLRQYSKSQRAGEAREQLSGALGKGKTEGPEPGPSAGPEQQPPNLPGPVAPEAAHAEIDALTPNEHVTSEQIQPTQLALRGLLKLGQGQPMESLTSVERAAVEAKAEDGASRVEMVKGKPVITDATLERVRTIAPTTAQLLPKSEEEQRQAIVNQPATKEEAETKPAKTESAPSTKEPEEQSTFEVEVQNAAGESRKVEVQAENEKAAREQVKGQIEPGEALIRDVTQTHAPVEAEDSAYVPPEKFESHVTSEIKKEIGRSFSPEEKAKLGELVKIAAPAYERWSKAFATVGATLKERGSGGVMFSPTTKTLGISILDLARHAKFYLNDSNSGEAMIRHEAAHAVTTASPEANAKVVELFKSAPERLKTAMKEAYRDERATDYNYAHELWAYALAGKIEMAAGNRIKLSGKFLPEQANRAFIAKYKRAFAEVLRFTRDIEGYLRKQGVAEDVIAQWKELEDLFVSRIKEVDAKSGEQGGDVSTGTPGGSGPRAPPSSTGPPESLGGAPSPAGRSVPEPTQQGREQSPPTQKAPARTVEAGAGSKLAKRPRSSAPDGSFTEHPLIASIINDHGGILSKSAALRQNGRAWFEANKSLWDGAPALTDPRHNKIYNPKSGQTPDKIASALAESGLLKDGDVEELWRKVGDVSTSSKRVEAQQRSQITEKGANVLEMFNTVARDLNKQINLPKGATAIRATDQKGRPTVIKAGELKGANPLHDAGPWKRIEAGTIGQGNKFVPMKELSSQDLLSQPITEDNLEEVTKSLGLVKAGVMKDSFTAADPAHGGNISGPLGMTVEELRELKTVKAEQNGLRALNLPRDEIVTRLKALQARESALRAGVKERLAAPQSRYASQVATAGAQVSQGDVEQLRQSNQQRLEGEQNAVRQRSTEEVLQREPSEDVRAGSGRGRVEPGQQGNETSREVGSGELASQETEGLGQPPTLRQGEKQGDLLSKQTEEFKLVGEKGTDFDAIKAAKEKAASDRAESAKGQLDLFTQEISKLPGRMQGAIKQIVEGKELADVAENIGASSDAVKRLAVEGLNRFADVQFADNKGYVGKNLHSLMLEQKNPAQLRAAFREPSGKIIAADAIGGHHFQVTASKEAEAGFVDKQGAFYSRSQAAEIQQKALLDVIASQLTPKSADLLSQAIGDSSMDPNKRSAFEKMLEEVQTRNPESMAPKQPGLAQRTAKLIPGLDILSDTTKGVQSLLLPSGKSPEHLAAAENLGRALGEMHRRQEASRFQLKPDWYGFEKSGASNTKTPLNENPGVKFMSAVSQGKPVEAKFQGTAAKIDRMFKDRLDLLEKAEVPLQTIRENYFPGMWSQDSRNAFNQAISEYFDRNPEAVGQLDLNTASQKLKAEIKERADQLLKQGSGSEKDMLPYLTRRPFKGGESFRKQKVFDDIMTAVDFGLRPISSNPIDLVMGKLAEMDKSIMANQALRRWEESGDVANFDNSGRPMAKAVQKGFDPAEWKKINDKYGTIWLVNKETGMLQKVGERWAKTPVADVLNNYLSSSLYNNRYFGKLYTGWMATANVLNQSQLGVGSAFHAGFTTGEVQVSAGSNVLKDTFGVMRGNRTIGNLLATAGRWPTAFFQTAIEGDTVLNAWRNPGGVIDPRISKIVRAAELAGGGFQMEQGLKTNQTDKMVSQWLSGSKVRAAMRSPVAFTELMAKPIMEFLVPRQKAGVFAHLAWRIIEQNPAKALEELTPEFRQAWNRVDARLGQVRYNRLFINNAAKNIVQGLVRAPGWTGGTIAELGGAFKDAGAFFKEWHDTGSVPQELPDRVAYALSLLLTVGLVNAAITYMFTGDKPHGEDFMAFRTGRQDEGGNPERFMLPTYLKDVWAYAKNAGGTLLNKTHPMISLFSDLVKNKDYYGVQISDPDANVFKRALQKGLYTIKAFEPFWTRGVRKASDRGAGLAEKALPFIGVMPAPRAMSLTPAQELIGTYLQQKHEEGGKTPDQAEKSTDKTKLLKSLRSGEVQPVKQAILDGKLTQKEGEALVKRAQETSLQEGVKYLTLDQGFRVFEKANDAEKAEMRDVLRTKNDSAFSREAITEEEYRRNEQALVGPVTSQSSLRVLHSEPDLPATPKKRNTFSIVK